MSNIVDVVEADKNIATMSESVKTAGPKTELAKQRSFHHICSFGNGFWKISK